MRTVKDTRVSLLSFLPGSKSGTVALSSTICICPPAPVEENGWRKGVGERERKDGKAKRMQAHTDTDTDTDAQTHTYTDTDTHIHRHTYTLMTQAHVTLQKVFWCSGADWGSPVL